MNVRPDGFDPDQLAALIDLSQSQHHCFWSNEINMKPRDPSSKTDPKNMGTWIGRKSKSAIEWTKCSVPPGLRLVLGLLLIGGGLLGFLPVLGFWMVPLGVAVAALDLRPFVQALMRLLRRRK